MAQTLLNVYETFDKPLTHEMLWDWHALLFNEDPSIQESGSYRTHQDPSR